MREHDEHEKLRCHPLVPRCLHGMRTGYVPVNFVTFPESCTLFLTFFHKVRTVLRLHSRRFGAHASSLSQIVRLQVFMFFDEYDYLGAIGETEQKLRVQTRRESVQH
jgi:hypothetical protein